jgi:hypothetical protein
MHAKVGRICGKNNFFLGQISTRKNEKVLPKCCQKSWPGLHKKVQKMCGKSVRNISKIVSEF